MSKTRVFITGVNGYIGCATVLSALAAGYRVTAAVRRDDAKDRVLRIPSLQAAFNSNSLTFEIIPDMTIKEAFVDAVRDCTHIIHTANPIAGIPGKDTYTPAVESIKALLHAAEVNSSVKRLVWTGSMIGNTAGFSETLTSHPRNQAIARGHLENIIPWTGETVAEEVPTNDLLAPTFIWYAWGKAATRRLLKEHAASTAKSSSSRQFDIVNLFLGWTIGPDARARNQEEALDIFCTNSILRHVFNDVETLFTIDHSTGVPNSPLGACPLHIQDAADAHIKALTVPAGKERLSEYILASNGPHGCVYSDAIAITRKNVPELAPRVDPAGHFGSMRVYFDASKTEEELLGRPFRTYEEQVTDFMNWFKGLPPGTNSKSAA